MKLLLIFVFFGMMAASVFGLPKASETTESDTLARIRTERAIFRRDVGSQDDLQPEASANHHGGFGGFGGHHGGFGGFGGHHGGFGGFGGHHRHHGGFYG